MQAAAFFDLDGTLITANSADLWTKRERRLGRMNTWHLAHTAFNLLLYKFGLLDIERALRAALSTIRDTSEADMRAEVRRWWAEDVRPHVAPGARAVIDGHRKTGDKLVLLTSSSLYASEMALEEFGLDAILCQGYEVREGRFTGAPLRPICYGPGKVEVAESWSKTHGIDLAASAFYSDSTTDVPMLERVGKPFVVHPDPLLRRMAARRGWPIIDWRNGKPR